MKMINNIPPNLFKNRGGSTSKNNSNTGKIVLLRILFILFLVAIFVFGAKAQVTFLPEDPNAPADPSCTQSPYFWAADPSGSINVCMNEAFSRSAVFDAADSDSRVVWTNSLYSTQMGTGQHLNCSGLTQTTPIYCDYVIPHGETCAGKYRATFTVNVDIHCTATATIDYSAIPQDVIWSGTEFVTSGGIGSISLTSMQGLAVNNIVLSAGQTNYPIIAQPGIYIANISYNGKNFTSKIYIQ